VKLVPHLRLPLPGQVRRTEDGQPLGITPVEELARDEEGLDRLADAHVVGDEQADRVQPKSHEERDELVGPWLHGDASERAERTGRRSDPEPKRFMEEPRRSVVTEVPGLGKVEVGLADRLERQVEACDLRVTAAQGSDDE
jgi:hypothetical protein